MVRKTVDLLSIVSIIGYLSQSEKREVACMVSCRYLMVCLYSTLGSVKQDLILMNFTFIP